MQQLFQTYRWYILGVLAAIVVLGAAYYYFAIPRAVPETSTFQSGNFSFTYPRNYEAREYATGVVSVGDTIGDSFIPLVDVVRYKSDPDRATPASFEAFVERQAAAFCGADASTESVSCASPVVAPYSPSAGLSGTELSLTLTKRNLKTGTTSSSMYGPIYVFNTTASSTPDEPLRYQGVFVYPTFSSFLLVGTTSPEFVESIASTIQTEK